MTKNITILGAGSWGTALGILLNSNNHNVKIWSRNQSEVENILLNRENKDFLPGVVIPKEIEFLTNLEDSIRDSEVIVMAVPSKAIREVSHNISPYITNQIIISVAKGLEEGTLLRLSEVIKQEISQSRVGVLSGPTHAEEVSRNIPSAIVAASTEIDIAKEIQDIFMTPEFRVYTNTDVVGVEISAAFKNIIALCAGISDGLGFGDNTKAALMTRGIAEMTRLGLKMGANPSTFLGLCSVGDLIVTCTSMHSRNRRAGILIGKGYNIDKALKEVKMVVEGVNTSKAAYELSKKYDVEMPITNEAYEVLFNGKPARQAVIELMTRDKKEEM